MKLGLIAGNGRFPFLVIEGAKRAGAAVAVAAIREETDPAIEKLADRFTWVGIGQLGKMLRFFKSEGVDKAIMAGRGKNRQNFIWAPSGGGGLNSLFLPARAETYPASGPRGPGLSPPPDRVRPL